MKAKDKGKVMRWLEMFKQKMNQEQKMYGQDIGCGCSVNVSVCVQGVCVCVCRRWGSEVSVWLGQLRWASKVSVWPGAV